MEKKVNYKFLLIGIFFLGLIIIIITYKNKIFISSNENTLLNTTIRFNKKFEQTIKLASLLKNKEKLLEDKQGYSITLEWEMKIPNTIGDENWGSAYNENKPLIRLGISPMIYYNPKTNKLIVSVKYRNNPIYTSIQNIEVKVPLQTWTKYKLYIKDRNLTISENDTIVKFIKLKNIPIISSNPEENFKIGESNHNILGEIRNINLYFNQDLKKSIFDF
jgi:hypothetical protein